MNLRNLGTWTSRAYTQKLPLTCPNRIFTGPWAKIVSAADSLADSHHTLAQRIEADVEKPLRRFTSQNREYQSMTTVQGHLNTLTTEIGSAQEKAEKLRRKGEKASVGKVAGASSSIEDATTEFQSQAPFVFEQLQALDEIRFNHLRDVLTQFQTHEVDQVERERVIAESTLNSILNVETADEIKTWAERMKSGGVPSLQAKDRSSRKTFVPAFPPTSPPILDEPEDNHSLKGGFSESRPSQRSMTGTSEEPKKSHGLAGGLKRLGTRIGRRRDKQILPDQETPPKSSKGRFGELNRSSTALPITQSSPTPQLPLPDRSAAFARPLSPLRHQSQNEQSAKTPATTEPAGISLVNGESQSGAEIQKPQMNGILAKPLIPETAKPVESPFPSETVLNNPTIPPQEPIQLREVVSESTPLHQSPLMTPEVPGQR